MAVKKKVSKKKKNWYTILSPKEFGEIELGRTLGKDGKAIINRIVETTADALLQRGKEQKIKVKLKINDVKETKAHTYIQEIKLSNSYLSRIVKKNSNKIESVLVLNSNDGKKFKIKMILLTKNKITRTKKTLLKKQLNKNAERILSKHNFINIINDALQNKTQKYLKEGLNKIAIIRKCLVARIKLL